MPHRSRHRLPVYLLLGLLWASATVGVAQDLRFEHFGIDDGLATNGGNDIVQDHQGYLWVATNLGLNRYDGYDFKRYLPDPEDSTSISGDFLRSLLVDRQGRLWVGTDKDAVYRLDPGREQFVRYPQFTRALLEDREGALWFSRLPATLEGGLARYDPETEAVTWYHHDEDDPNSLSHQFVSCVYEDREGTIWVGTLGGGLNRFDRDTGAFTRYVHDPNDERSLISDIVWVLFEDSRGTFWVGTDGDGLHTMDRDAGTFTRHTYDPNDPTKLSRPHLRERPYQGSLVEIYEDRHGVLWFGAYLGGLNRFDPATGALTHYEHDPDNPTGLWTPNSNSVSSIYETHEGTLWIGGGGLNKLIPSPQGLTHIPITSADPDGDFAGVYAVLEARDGTRWLGTDEGLERRDAITGATTRYRHDPLDPSSLSADTLSALYVDRDGTLWVGALGGGLSHFNASAEAFTHYRHDPNDEGSLTDDYVWRIYEDRRGEVWITTYGGGLHRLDLGTGDITRIFALRMYDPSWFDLLDRLDAEGRSLAGLLKVGPGQTRQQPFELREETPVLIAHQAWLWQVDWLFIQGGIWTEGGELVYRTRPEETVYGGGSLRNRVAMAIDTLAPGRYVLTYGNSSNTYGYGRWNGVPPDHPERWGIQVYTLQGRALPEIMPAAPQPPTQGLEGDFFVTSLHEDAGDTLWVGTDAGFHRLDREANTFVLDPSKPHVDVPYYHVLVDRQGVWWIGTSARTRGGNRLIRFDPASGSRETITTGIGLPSSWIFDLLEDEAGRLWVSSYTGLAMLDAGAQALRPFDTGTGLSARTWSPSWSSAHRGRSGLLYFGQRDGVTVIDPAQGIDATPPRVVLTGVRVFEDPVQSVPGSSVGQAAPVTLAHDRNEVTFDYVGIYLRRPAETRYAYRLEGYEDEWRNAGTQRRATYTSLPPGAYTFRVRAANADGVWNEEGASIRITIKPPWWRTWWAYAVYALLVIGAVIAAFRVQHARIVRKEREQWLLKEKDLRADAAEAWANYLQAENQRQTQELEAARTLQLSMLPDTVPDHPRVDLAASMRTASEVGGDYYDFDLSDDGTLTIAIGDATGHGTKAGTMVTATKSLWHAFSGEPDLALVLEKSSRALKQMGLPKLYMALALARLRDHTLELVGAGLPPALVYRAGTGAVETVPLKGIPLGGPGRNRYRKQCVMLSPGDTVALMTDGFPERFSDDGEMLGYDRAVAMFAEVADRSSEEIIGHLMQRGEAWAHGRAQDDDVTFVVMKMKARPDGKGGGTA